MYSIVMFSLIYTNIAYRNASAEESERSSLIISYELAEGDSRELKFNLKDYETDVSLSRHFPYSIGEEHTGMVKDGDTITVSGSSVLYISNLPSAYNYKIEVSDDKGYTHQTRNFTGRIRSALDRRATLMSVVEDK